MGDFEGVIHFERVPAIWDFFGDFLKSDFCVGGIVGMECPLRMSVQLYIVMDSAFRHNLQAQHNWSKPSGTTMVPLPVAIPIHVPEAEFPYLGASPLRVELAEVVADALPVRHVFRVILALHLSLQIAEKTDFP